MLEASKVLVLRYNMRRRLYAYISCMCNKDLGRHSLNELFGTSPILKMAIFALDFFTHLMVALVVYMFTIYSLFFFPPVNQ